MFGPTLSALSQVGRLTREPSLQAAAIVATAPVTAAGLHAVGISTDLDTTILSMGLVDPTLWFTLAMAAAFGGIGGFVAELLSLHGNIELPHRVNKRSHSHAKRTRLADPHDMVDLGVLSRMLLGAAAALALLSVYAPATATALLVNALIAGSAATAVFRLVQGRLLGSSAPRSDKKPEDTVREIRKVA
jgi:hypothetical protein